MNKKIIVPDITKGKEPVEITLTENNWANEFPYQPEVKARISHDEKNLYLQYSVDEKHIAAKADHDNGDVWKDSCAEFFISFDDKGYYNIESNCIGKVLMSHRKSRKEGVEYASPETLSGILRNPSLGDQPFSCKESNEPWKLSLTIPASSFFKNNIENLSGVKARCNVYKCGDELPEPHFISWNPIKTEKPDFHRPEFFGEIEFE